MIPWLCAPSDGVALVRNLGMTIPARGNLHAVHTSTSWAPIRDCGTEASPPGRDSENRLIVLWGGGHVHVVVVDVIFASLWCN